MRQISTEILLLRRSLIKIIAEILHRSLVMPPAMLSWVTNTNILEWLKSLGK